MSAVVFPPRTTRAVKQKTNEVDSRLVAEKKERSASKQTMKRQHPFINGGYWRRAAAMALYMIFLGSSGGDYTAAESSRITLFGT